MSSDSPADSGDPGGAAEQGVTYGPADDVDTDLRFDPTPVQS